MILYLISCLGLLSFSFYPTFNLDENQKQLYFNVIFALASFLFKGQVFHFTPTF